MSAPPTTAALKGLGDPKSPFLVIDPGKQCGIALYCPGDICPFTVNTAGLDELPALLRWFLAGATDFDVGFVVCEDFSLGSAMRNDPKVPSAIGIGMCRVACEWTDTPLYLAPKNGKRAGQMYLESHKDRDGAEARAACRNDHERDVVDFAGYVLREMRHA